MSSSCRATRRACSASFHSTALACTIRRRTYVSKSQDIYCKIKYARVSTHETKNRQKTVATRRHCFVVEDGPLSRRSATRLLFLLRLLYGRLEPRRRPVEISSKLRFRIFQCRSSPARPGGRLCGRRSDVRRLFREENCGGVLSLPSRRVLHGLFFALLPLPDVPFKGF